MPPIELMAFLIHSDGFKTHRHAAIASAIFKNDFPAYSRRRAPIAKTGLIRATERFILVSYESHTYSAYFYSLKLFCP